MITAIALMCAIDNPSNCQAIHRAMFFRTVEECEADIGNAAIFIESQGMYLRDYRCVVWGYPA
jgi:hypothetical protein